MAHQKERRGDGRRRGARFEQHVGVTQIVREHAHPRPIARRFPVAAQIDRDHFDARRVQSDRQRVVTPRVLAEAVNKRDARVQFDIRRGLPAMQEQFHAASRRDCARRINMPGHEPVNISTLLVDLKSLLNRM